MRQPIARVVWFALGVMLASGQALGQGREEGMVSGMGTYSVQAKPARLRMFAQLQSYGKTVELALERLKACRETAAAKLTTLQADPSSIAFSSPQVSRPSSGFSAGRSLPTFTTPAPTSSYAPSPPPDTASSRPASPHVPRLFLVSTTLRAEWPLKEREPDQIAVWAHALQEQVAAADLAGAKNLKELTPEEQELVEEGNPGGPYAPRPTFLPPSSPPMPYPTPYSPYSPGASPSAPGAPTFVYVAVLSGPARQEALAGAYAQARRQAEELAELAEARLGPIASLRCDIGNSIQFGVAYGPEYGSSPLVSNTETEAVAAMADQLKFTLRVSANYHLRPK